MDYSKLSNEDLAALYNNDYSKLSDEGLKALYDTDNNSLQGQGTEKSPFRLAVEKVAEPWINYEKGIVQGLTSFPNALAKKGANKIRPLIGKKPLSDEEYAQKTWLYQKPNNFASSLGYAVGSAAPTLLLPEVKALQGTGKVTQALAQGGNRALTGAYQGGLIGGTESLANDGNLSGVIPGAVGGATVNVGLPIAGKGIEKSANLLPMTGGWVGRTFGRIQPETLQRAVQADSKALDLSPQQAQNLLSNVTERVRTGYNNLLQKRGDAISNAEENLRKLADRIDVNHLADDITEVFNRGQGERINTTRDLTGNLEDELLELVYKGADETGTISPIDLQRIKQEVGQMTNWADTTRPKIQNTTLEQIYGNFNNRLMNLSPELQQANKSYAQLKNFQNNEGLKRVLKPGDNIDSASSALKNYNTTVTKGNTNRNIQDLERELVADGQKPFLNEIDDINAAMDLNNIRGTGDSFYANLGTALARPVLKGIRQINRSGLPQAYKSLKQVLPKNFVPYAYGLKELIDRD